MKRPHVAQHTDMNKFIYHGMETERGRFTCRKPGVFHVDKGDKVFFKGPSGIKFIEMDFAGAEKRILAWTNETRIRR